MDVYTSRFQTLASYATSLGSAGVRQVLADQLGTLIGLSTGHGVVITPDDLRCVTVTAETPAPGDPLDSVLTFHVEASLSHSRVTRGE